MIKLQKCKLKNCLLNEKEGTTNCCSQIVPSIVKKLKPDNPACEFYSTDLEKEKEWLKTKGGLLGLIMSSSKKMEKDLKEELKEKKKKKTNKK